MKWPGAAKLPAIFLFRPMTFPTGAVAQCLKPIFWCNGRRLNLHQSPIFQKVLDDNQ